MSRGGASGTTTGTVPLDVQLAEAEADLERLRQAAEDGRASWSDLNAAELVVCVLRRRLGAG